MLTACFNDSADCVQVLLQNGAEKDIVDKDGLSAVSLAAKLGHQTVLGEIFNIKNIFWSQKVLVLFWYYSSTLMFNIFKVRFQGFF